ncbi:MAG: hypothetical protein GWP06_13180 [Actinobacteria bacterium]|nr:hypothetical protein [Actinomycetota bacterium]
MKCYKCGYDIITDEKVFRQEACPQCKSYIHCCLNCRFYDVLAHHQCREPQARWVKEKDSANFCSYFEPSGTQKSVSTAKTNEAKRKLEELFKKK